MIIRLREREGSKRDVHYVLVAGGMKPLLNAVTCVSLSPPPPFASLLSFRSTFDTLLTIKPVCWECIVGWTREKVTLLSLPSSFSLVKSCDSLTRGINQ